MCDDFRDDWDDEDGYDFDDFLKDEGISQDEYDAMTMAEQDALMFEYGMSLSSEDHDRELGPHLDSLGWW